MSSPGVPRQLNYALIRQYVSREHPKKILMRVNDANRQEDWILRLEMRQGQMEAQRYAAAAVDPTLMQKTLEYGPVSLQMLFQQLLDVEGSPYRMTGMTTESS